MQNQQSSSSMTVTEEQRNLIDRFIATYNEIDSHLRKLVNMDGSVFFPEVLNEVKNQGKARTDFEFLRRVNKVRILLAHDNKRVNQYLAVPVIGVVEKLEKIRDELLNPVKVIPKYQRSVMIFNSENTLQEVLTAISENDYSQFPIQDEDRFMGLLTENGITRGLARYTKNIDSIIEFKETPVRLLLQEEEIRKNFQFISCVQSVMDAEMLFVRNPELEALLITHSGKPHESLLGIITRWDILHLWRE